MSQLSLSLLLFVLVASNFSPSYGQQPYVTPISSNRDFLTDLNFPCLLPVCFPLFEAVGPRFSCLS